GLPEARNVSYMAEMWEPYLRFKPAIHFSYVYYYDTNDSTFLHSSPGQSLRKRTEDRAKELGLDISIVKSPEEIRKIVNLQPEDYRLIMRLTYRGRSELLRTYPSYNNPWPDLTNVAAVFKRLLHPDKIPTVYFVTGELERNIFKFSERQYALYTTLKTERTSLVNIGFNIDSLNLATQEIPTNCTALILADAKMYMSNIVQKKLNNYLQLGGNMFIIGEPGKQAILNPLIQNLGVQFMNGQLVQPSYHETP